MDNEQKLDRLVYNSTLTWPKRVVALASCILVYAVWKYGVCPYVQPIQKQMFIGLEGGPKQFVTNLMLYNSFLYAVLSVLAIFLLVKAKIFRSPSLKQNAKSAALQGLTVGLIILVLSIGFRFLVGSRFHLNFDLWEYGGNLFSNAYEEIFYRGLMFVGVLAFFRRAWPAAILSGLLFGLTHTQYPLGIQLGVAVIGVAFGFLYYRSGNLIAPWIAHQVGDLLDTFF